MHELSEQASSSQHQDIITVFSAYIAFVVGGLLFYGMVDDSTFVGLMRQQLDVQAAWIAVEAGAVVALLAVLAGGIPLALAALRFGVERQRGDVVLLLITPALALVFLALVGIGVHVVTQGHLPTDTVGQVLLLVTVGGSFLLAAVSSTAGVVLATVRSTINPGLWRFAKVPAVITVIAMALMSLATLIWGITAYGHASADFMVVAFFDVNALEFWLMVLTVMISATLVASVALFRTPSKKIAI